MSSVTIVDVAALAGVSIKTVSRVVNGEPHVRPEMREKVMSAIASLNYKPNLAARALAGSRAYLLGLYYDNPSPGYVSSVQFGAMTACRKAGYHLLVEELDKAVSRDHIQTLLSTVKVDGLVLSPPVSDRTELLDVLDEIGLPYVRIAPADQLDRAPYVYIDDRKAACEMTRHLQQLGHRRIGFVKGHTEHSVTPLRYQGFKQTMEEAGLEVRPEWVQWGNFTFRSGVGAAERLLNQPERPTAIFASNDDMALGVMAQASRQQLHLPNELSVAGFDDSPIAQVVWPQLTTIRQPVEKMAFEAVTMLIQGLTRRQVPGGKLLDFELIIRGSTASPNA